MKGRPSRTSSGCQRIRYPDELSARLVLATIRRRRARSAGKVERRAYLCARCYGWHLTSQAVPDAP